jgi:hypothetical protein
MSTCNWSNCAAEATWPKHRASGDPPLYCAEHGEPTCQFEDCPSLAVGTIAIPQLDEMKRNAGLDGTAMACEHHAHPAFFSVDGVAPTCELCTRGAVQVVIVPRRTQRVAERDEYTGVKTGAVREIITQTTTHLACPDHASAQHFARKKAEPRRGPGRPPKALEQSV